MGLLLHGPDFAVRMMVPIEELLAPALTRLRRQKAYARVLGRSGSQAAGLEHWLTRASDCILALARPELVLKPLPARRAMGGVEVGGTVTLGDAELVRDIAAGGRLTGYLLTLGYEQGAAFEALGDDYAAHHIQTDLASEALFALGRMAHRLQRADAPGSRLRRVSLQTAAQCGETRTWDPAQVQALLGCFDGVNPGVAITGTGCFQPLNSMLGLTVRT